MNLTHWIQRSGIAALAAGLVCVAVAVPVHAFCGFYVAKADADLWNNASQVILVRDEDRTVLTMANDYRGDLTEFALVVPVPVVLEEGQIRVGERSILERLDAFSAPRLVEYFDPDPCNPPIVYSAGSMQRRMEGAVPDADRELRAKNLGVTIEAEYTVGEYDILILSAKESEGLETWLVQEGYRLPKGAHKALQPYIRQGLKFFVAKVNLEEQAKTGFTYLRPLQMAYESPRFMLPLRLGMLNAQGPQDLIVYFLTRKGRVETSNYRTARVPTDVEIPPYVKEEFPSFYTTMFQQAWEREGKDAVFLEYFWDLKMKCDPCTADLLTAEELRQAGVFWLEEAEKPDPRRGRPFMGWGPDARLTRLHIRYDDEHFPEDLFFKETSDRQNWQGRYVLRHPFGGNLDCEAGRDYEKRLAERQEEECRTLANLTGWDIADIREKAGLKGDPPKPKPWWYVVFGDGS